MSSFPDMSKSLNESLQTQNLEVLISVDDEFIWYPAKITRTVEPVLLRDEGEEILVDRCSVVFDDPDDDHEYSCSFMGEHLVVFEILSDDLNDIEFTWWRIKHDHWEPEIKDANEYLHRNFKPELSDRSEIESLVNDLLGNCLSSKTIQDRMNSLSRDEQCYVTDVIVNGKEELIVGIQAFLAQKRIDEPHYEMSPDDFKDILSTLKS